MEGAFGLANTYIEERAVELARYVIENKSTVRETAKRFYISKSTVHKDIVERLKVFDRNLYLDVKRVLDENKAERHLRGGMATRRKYRGEDSNK
ncbi:MAG: stage III sporulation protein D [Clostridiales bacterium]|jgi:putative DeoR family transcriptional regulator (stage III sporulation protein D)|nr:stage III sporulation protein D [Clostridiales bacterium]